MREEIRKNMIRIMDRASVSYRGNGSAFGDFQGDLDFDANVRAALLDQAADRIINLKGAAAPHLFAEIREIEEIIAAKGKARQGKRNGALPGTAIPPERQDLQKITGKYLAYYIAIVTQMAQRMGDGALPHIHAALSDQSYAVSGCAADCIGNAGRVEDYEKIRMKIVRDIGSLAQDMKGQAIATEQIPDLAHLFDALLKLTTKGTMQKTADLLFFALSMKAQACAMDSNPPHARTGMDDFLGPKGTEFWHMFHGRFKPSGEYIENLRGIAVGRQNPGWDRLAALVFLSMHMDGNPRLQEEHLNGIKALVLNGGLDGRQAYSPALNLAIKLIGEFQDSSALPMLGTLSTMCKYGVLKRYAGDAKRDIFIRSKPAPEPQKLSMMRQNAPRHGEEERFSPNVVAHERAKEAGWRPSERGRPRKPN